MYTDADFSSTHKKTIARLIVYFAFVAAAVAVLFILNGKRLQYPMYAFAAVSFALFFFVWSFKISPWVRYDRYMREMRNGRKRETVCKFVSFTPETRMHDGVEVHDLIVSEGPEKDDERLFYWDADKKAPELKAGATVKIISYGNFVVELQSA